MQSPDDTPISGLLPALGQVSSIAGPEGDLEIAFQEAESADANKIVLICHPHPQHGGTMDNKVVTTLARTYSKLGWHSLRFNFRGVGKSAGSYGEFIGEIEDAKAIFAFLRNGFPDAVIALAGFSFGSAVAANVALGATDIAHLLLVAPPVGKYDLDYPNKFSCPTLVIQGGIDDIVDLEKTRNWADSVSGKFIYCELAESGHFFHGKLTELADTLTENFSPRTAAP